jgi:hypothetical protein
MTYDEIMALTEDELDAILSEKFSEEIAGYGSFNPARSIEDAMFLTSIIVSKGFTHGAGAKMREYPYKKEDGPYQSIAFTFKDKVSGKTFRCEATKFPVAVCRATLFIEAEGVPLVT